MQSSFREARGGPGSSSLLTFPPKHGKRRQQLSRDGEKGIRSILNKGVTSNPEGRRNVQKRLPRQQKVDAQHQFWAKWWSP